MPGSAAGNGTRSAWRFASGISGLLWLLDPGTALAQNRSTVEPERREFAQWLEHAALSPRRAVGIFPVGPGLTLGPASSAIPLAGVAPATITEQAGRVFLRGAQGEVPLAPGRAIGLGDWRLVRGGSPGHTVVTVFGPKLLAGKAPEWFAYDPSLVFTVTLAPAETASAVHVLAPDGTDVEATEAGSVSFQLRGRAQRLRVRRLPGASEEETELEAYFRDATSSSTTYPAGRFVALVPLPGGKGRYILDFNRARNPFCAYNTVYPCPAPWSRNTLTVPIGAGERYRGGGPTPPSEP